MKDRRFQLGLLVVSQFEIALHCLVEVHKERNVSRECGRGLPSIEHNLNLTQSIAHPLGKVMEHSFHVSARMYHQAAEKKL